MARITTETQRGFVITPKTGRGNVAPIDGTMVFDSSDPTVATVAADPSNPMRAVVVGVSPGVCQVSAEFDADLDVGETRTIRVTGAIEVVAAEAQTAEIVFEDEVPQPDLNAVITSGQGFMTPGN